MIITTSENVCSHCDVKLERVDLELQASHVRQCLRAFRESGLLVPLYVSARLTLEKARCERRAWKRICRDTGRGTLRRHHHEVREGAGREPGRRMEGEISGLQIGKEEVEGSREGGEKRRQVTVACLAALEHTHSLQQLH